MMNCGQKADESIKLQAPRSREAPSSKSHALRPDVVGVLGFGASLGVGAWSLELFPLACYLPELRMINKDIRFGANGKSKVIIA
jgi:hypothetical protein